MPKLTVFVACPYAIFPLEDYKKVFADVARNYDVRFLFADEQITSQHILSKITNYIRDHDICLFDITGWNPNVTLELGIALGFGKRYFILLITRLDQSKDVPSDIRGIDRIQYTSNAELEAKIILLMQQEIPGSDSKSDSAFDSVKKKVLDVLQGRPGLGISAIAEATSEDKLLVQSVVRAMIQNGDLKTTGQKKGTKYYVKEFDLRRRKKSEASR